MAVPVVNLSIDQGTRFSTSLKIKLDGGALNLSGYTFSSKLKKHYAATTSYPFTVSIASTSSGIISIGMASTITATIPPGRYVYDVISTLSGVPNKVVEGTVIVKGTAT